MSRFVHRCFDPYWCTDSRWSCGSKPPGVGAPGSAASRRQAIPQKGDTSNGYRVEGDTGAQGGGLPVVVLKFWNDADEDRRIPEGS